MRMEFSKPTRREALARARGQCEGVGKVFGLTKGDRCTNSLSYGVYFEHINPDANSRDNSLENCAAVCPKCWRWKTDHYDKPLVSKTDRQWDRAHGIGRRKSAPMLGTKQSGWRKKMNGEIERR